MYDIFGFLVVKCVEFWSYHIIMHVSFSTKTQPLACVRERNLVDKYIV